MESETLKFVWKGMDDWKNDIEKYRNGELSSSQMHDLEKRALQDPFLADALEGAEQIPLDDFSSDVEELNFKIQARSDQRMVASMSASKIAKEEAKAPIKFIWPLRIAASVILIVGMFWLASQLIPAVPNQNLALKKEESQPASPPAEELKEQEESKNIVSDTNAETIKPKQSTASNNSGSSVSKFTRPENGPTAQPLQLKEKQKEVDVKSEKIIIADKMAELTDEEKVALVSVAESDLKKSNEPIAAVPMAARKKSLSASNEIIKGSVLSEEDGTPIPGVNVIIQGTTIGTVTDEKGNYQLPAEASNKNLVFSFIGFQSQSLPIGDNRTINVKLMPDVSQLSEVVVVGYGATKDDAAREPIVKRAEPKGGIRAYDKYLDANVRYPASALAKNIKGKVQIRFTVKTDGQLEDFQVVKSLGNGCDEEVVRLVKEGPAWSPTTEDNVPVETEVLVKVKFDPAKAKK